MSSFEIEKNGTQCVVTWRHFSWAVLFLLFWLAIWTAGCVMLGYAVFVKTQFGMILFAIPFWAGWVFVFCIIVDMIFGKTRVRLDENGFDTKWSCLFLTQESHLSLAGIRRFETHIQTSRKGGSTYHLRTVFYGKDVDFMTPTGEKDLNDLCDQLNDFLKILKSDRQAVAVKEEPETPAKKSGLPEPIVFQADSMPQNLEVPENSRWRYYADFDGFGFRQRGEVKITDLFGSLFGAVFWNGIVSVFVLQLFGLINPEQQPKGGSWWFMFLFLIPFVLIGLAIIGAAANNILELFRRTSWTFTYGEAKYRSVRLGPAHVETVPLTAWNSLLVRIPPDDDDADENEEDEDEDAEESLEFYESCSFWELAFLDSAGKEQLTIFGLTKPEALWMADVVLREKKTIR